MLSRLFHLLHFGCSHRNTSQPFAAARQARRAAGSDWEPVGAAAPAAAHYVVCLDCGRKFTYDWQKMRIVR